MDRRNVTEIWDASFEYTRTAVRDYWKNHAYLEGYHWLFWSPVENRLEFIPEDVDRIRVTMNHMRANARTMLANLVQRALVFEVPPSSYDDATRKAASLGEGLLEEKRVGHNWESLREAHIYTTLKGGVGAVSVDWSEANKDTVETVLSISEFVIEPGARTAEDARWWIRQILLPPGEVQAMFDLKDEPDADGLTGLSTEYSYHDREAPRTRVFTYYERPNPLTPEGLIRVEVNGVTLQEGPWPFPWKDKLNIRVATETPIENEWMGTTILTDARSPQTALNAAWSGLIEHLREAGNHRLLLPDTWADQVNTLNDRAGAPLTGPFSEGTPSYLTAPNLPNTATEAIAMLKEEIDTLMGVHAISRGDAPANIESGYGLSILAEKDSTPEGRLLKETARVWEGVAHMVLELHQAEVSGTQESVVRTQHGPARLEWSGKDLLGQTNVKIPMDEIMPRSRAAQQQLADRALQMGLINPEDPMAVLKWTQIADMPDQKGVLQAVMPDANKAIEENELVVMGEIPIPEPFDNHEIHMQIHNDFRKTRMYRQMTDEQRESIDDHVSTHEQLLMEEAGGQRAASDIDPAAGLLPTATGAAPVEALPPPEQPETTEGGPEEELAGADMISEDMLAAIQAIEGGA